ncbi:GNAT family N-acetyltransferase [Devosia algicola]|uniref:GNAT family N-acetyltransferase n=1 Tax=Devosia algicola TaxID=3026418 RepID=A0ABY7YKA3_9HYPH|nr:GNAT family N-acetyltransferase [Devosia algicola]WDR01730.1 GNAT family N-acetyltransferase [Devosia algicola]
MSNITVTTDLASIEKAWRSFEMYAASTPFQTFEWLNAWYSVIGSVSNVTPAIVCGSNEDGSMAFILPLAVERLSGSRRLVFLGRDLSDYNAPLLAPDFDPGTSARDWWKRVHDTVQQASGCHHDLVFLDKMPERVGEQPNPLSALPTRLNPSHAYATGLNGDWDSFYAAKRSSHARRNDRRKFRHLQNEGVVSFRTASEHGEIRDTLDILFNQKARSFERMGVPDLFEKPGVAEFFRQIAIKAPDLIHVSRLEVGSACVAANLGLVAQNTYYSVLISHVDGPLSRHSPGTFHQHDLMRHAMARGCDVFDFTIGDEPFKRDWADAIYNLHDHLAAVTPLGVAVAIVTSARLQAKRFIKQTPRLWLWASRARAGLGSLLIYLKTGKPMPKKASKIDE